MTLFAFFFSDLGQKTAAGEEETDSRTRGVKEARGGDDTKAIATVDNYRPMTLK